MWAFFRLFNVKSFLAFCFFVAVTYSSNNNSTNDTDVEQELLRFFLSSKINDPHVHSFEIYFNTSSFMADQSEMLVKSNNTNETVETNFSVENSTLDLIADVSKKNPLEESWENSTSIILNGITTTIPHYLATTVTSIYLNNSDYVSDFGNVSMNESQQLIEQVQCRLPLVQNSTLNNTETLVYLTLNFTHTRDDSFLSVLCEKILAILCDDLRMEKSSCDLNLHFFEPSDLPRGFSLSTTAFSVVDSSGASLLGSKVLFSLKKHQKRLEKELGLNVFKHVEITYPVGHDLEIFTALTAAIAAVCIAALLSLVVLIVWQTWRRQSSGEWVLNKPSRDKFDVVYFENGGYAYDDKHLSKTVLYPNEKFDTKMSVSSESTSRSVQTFNDSSDDICLVPKEMMEMFEKSFPSPKFD